MLRGGGPNGGLRESQDRAIAPSSVTYVAADRRTLWLALRARFVAALAAERGRWTNNIMKRLLIWLAQVPVVTAALILWPAIDWMGLSPIATAVLLSLGVLTALASFVLTQRLAWVIPSATLLAMLLLVGVVDFSPVQPATRAVRRVRPGMLETEVRAVLRDEFPASGRFHPPGLERPIADDLLSFVLDPSDGAYDAAFIQVQFADGRAMSVRFLPD
jgi:hypothetical protein